MARDTGAVQAAKRFLIRTYGCQMNVHDTEKVANLLLHCHRPSCDRRILTRTARRQTPAKHGHGQQLANHVPIHA